jgi:hypothetical protein
MRAAQAGDRQAYWRAAARSDPVRARTAAPLLLAPTGYRGNAAGYPAEPAPRAPTYDPRRPFRPWLGAIAARRGIDGLGAACVWRVTKSAPMRESYETFSDPAANIDIEAVRARR